MNVLLQGNHASQIESESFENKLKGKTEWVYKSEVSTALSKSTQREVEYSWKKWINKQQAHCQRCCVSIYMLMLFLLAESFVYLHKQMSSIFSFVSFSRPSLSAQSIPATQVEVIQAKSTKKIQPIPLGQSGCISIFCYCNSTIQTATYTSLNCIKPFAHWTGYPNGVRIHCALLSTIIVYSLNQSI